MKKLNQKGKFALTMVFVLLFVIVVAIIDQIRFELDENKSEDNYQLLINNKVVEPSRVVSKKNFIFDHYKDEEKKVKIPHDSTVVFPEKYELYDAEGERIYGDVSYLPDGDYRLLGRHGDYSYEYNLVVDNDFYVTLDTTNARQGGYVVANYFDINDNEQVSAKATFTTGKEILNRHDNVLVPIDFNTEVGTHTITFKSKKSSYDINVDVLATPSEEIYIYIPEYEKKTEPESEAYDKMLKALATVSKDKKYTTFKKPTSGVVSTEFGEKLYINNDENPTVINLAIDYADSDNTPVYATTDGEVVFVGEMEVYGKVVIIDHGYGIVSSYYHLNEYLVEEGAVVNSETEIGKMGATGNVSGTHLNFQIQINGIPVDPNIFLANNLNF